MVYGNLLIRCAVDRCYSPFGNGGRLVELDGNVIKAHLPFGVVIPVKRVQIKGLYWFFELVESFLEDVIMSSNREL